MCVLSVCPHLRLLIRCLLKNSTGKALESKCYWAYCTEVLHWSYQWPIMIISIKPVGLLNTDNVRKIDGLRRVIVRGVMEQVRKDEELQEG